MSYVSTPPYLYQHQADAVLNQANPVSGTRYTVLNTVNARIISIMVKVTWTVQPTPLEIHITIDGQTIRFSFDNPVSATSYMCNTMDDTDPGFQPLSVNLMAAYRAFLLEGRSIKIEAETTGGTVQNLYARVKYAKIP